MNDTQPQMNIDLSNTQKLEFDGKVVVQEGFILRKVSKFVTGQSEDGVMPIPVFFDVATGKVIKDTLPKALQEEYGDQAI